MVTELGRFLRKLRIDESVTMRQMASCIGISTAFLSAIELGKKKITNELIDKIIEKYNLDKSITNNLKDAAWKANGEIKLSLKSFNENDQENVLVFARNFSSLTDEKKNKIRKLLNEE